MKRKRNTILFLLLLVILIMIGFLIQKFFLGKSGTRAIIEQNGETIAELDLSKNTELVLNDGNGGSNTITVSNGQISVTDANCPDLVCVRTGAISQTGEVIACLPHKLIITISSVQTDSLDGLTW